MFKSIFFKLFVIITTGFVLFIGIMLFIQSAFFEDFYIYKKTNIIKNNLKSITEPYSKTLDIYSKDIEEITENYSKKFSALVFYYDYVIKSSKVTGDNKGIIAGKVYGDTNFFTDQIKYGEKLYKTSSYGEESIIYNTRNEDDVVFIISVSAIKSGGNITGLLYTFTMLQMKGETTSIIRDYYIIFYIISFVLVMLLSYVYSRKISRPLIHLNDIASRISELDFSVECTIKSKDELGNLSRTINKLSGNIEMYIKKISESNNILKRELEKEKELDVMRNEFVAGASHELKTPITIIQGYVQALHDKIKRNESVDDYLIILGRETQRMNTLVTEMLDLSQLESGKIQLLIEPLSISRFIKYVLKKLSPAIEEKKLNIQMGDYDDSFLVLGDGSRIEQVLENILNNAIKYTSVGGIIRISLISREDDILVEIENSGSKIKDEDLDKIWEKFYRVEKSRNKTSGGTGLGLSIVKNILELHKSCFGVKNTEFGVMFYFTLKKCE